jgi:autotransporter adhesin
MPADAVTMDLNSSGLNVVVGPDSGHLEVEETTVALYANDGGTGAGNGFFADANTGSTQVTGEDSARMTGGGTNLELTSSGARYSDVNGGPVRVTGVANGVDPFDAVNMSQLNDMETQLSAGISSAIAMTQLPAPRPGSNYSFGIATGFYNGEKALAVGGAIQLDNSITVNSAYSYSSAGGSAFGMGAGISW